MREKKIRKRKKNINKDNTVTFSHGHDITKMPFDIFLFSKVRSFEILRLCKLSKTVGNSFIGRYRPNHPP